nr:unnamed protein product [Callosobruchus chinensis]
MKYFSPSNLVSAMQSPDMSWPGEFLTYLGSCCPYYLVYACSPEKGNSTHW